MISMNYFQRNVREALASLRQQYVTLTQNRTTTNYFLALNFQELDKMKLYMFKIYQLTQEIYYQSFLKVIEEITKNYLLFSILFMVAYILLFLAWLYYSQIIKQKLSLMYAQLVLIPFNLLKTNVRVVNSFK